MLDLIDELAQLIRAIDGAGIDYAVCGGLALAIYGIPRATIDIDLLIESDAFDRLKQLAHGLGYRFEAAPMSFKGGTIQMRRVTKIDPSSAEVLSLDLLLVTPALAGEELGDEP